VRVGVVYCPDSISTNKHCHSNKTWLSNPGWASILTTTFRKATVAYSGTNGTILAHKFSAASEISAPVNASEMLQGFRAAWGNFTDMTSIVKLVTDPEESKLFTLRVYPAMVWSNLKGIDALRDDPTVATRAADTLQCLLAIMLYFCQPAVFSRILAPYANNATLGDSMPLRREFADYLLSISPPDTIVTVADLRYQLVVGSATVIAYIALCGTALVICAIALGWSACTTRNRPLPWISSFPSFDQAAKCKIQPTHQNQGVREEGLGNISADALIKRAETIKVMLERV
jgi:hypothetical protein